MVTNAQTVAHILNMLSNEHYLVQFLVKLCASTVKTKGTGVLQTFRQFQNENKFQHNSSIF